MPELQNESKADLVSKCKNVQCEISKGWGQLRSRAPDPSTTREGGMEGKNELKFKGEDSNLIATDC